MKKWYKIVELRNSKLKTLFHGLNGSKILQTNIWLDAEIKIVSDGKGTKYISGWHLISNYNECSKYLTKFKNQDHKKIITCYAKCIREKKHSPHNVFLAESIFILDYAF